MTDQEQEHEHDIAGQSDPTPVLGVFNCPACGDVSVPEGKPGNEVLRCTVCNTILALGVPQPNVIVQPDATDQRFLLLTFETMIAGQKTTATYKVVRGFAKAIGQNILSICP